MNMKTGDISPVKRTNERATPALVAGLKAPARFKAVCMAALNLRDGWLVMVLPDGRRLAFGDGDGPEATLVVKSWAFAYRLVRNGDIGLAEGYMAGEWDTPDLSVLLTFLSGNADRVVRILRGNPMMQMMNLFRNLGRENTRAGSRRNILAHYDLGNRFYAAWLDRTMTYSAARFDEKPGADLANAQLAKYRSLAHSMRLKPGEHVLEIGCGWGCEGLSDRVDLRMLDYRDVSGQFDKVASIEMFEAVGEKYWPAYFAKISEVLKPGGTAGLQIITIRDDLFDAYRKRVDFIQQYVFPGGMLPSRARLGEETARAGLTLEQVQAFGVSYADTLAEWGRRFRRAWGEINQLGFDERFRRLWQFYLSYCEAGFRSGRTDVVQIALTKA
ncbi:MAG: cyclopropane-fatty-acyl-phospholipid synthase [Alphaproteobacteria bacterium]|nr:MAG: cyclopropane-fatty-acyl-phospholipid synthase [Alphaproteobacteria bacterium]